jgi:hypothetical protein
MVLLLETPPMEMQLLKSRSMELLLLLPPGLEMVVPRLEGLGLGWDCRVRPVGMLLG